MTAMDVGSGGARRCGRGPGLAQASRGVEVTNSLAKAAERFLRRQVAMEDASPFHAAPAARAEHAARLSEAQGATTGPGGRVLPGPTNRGEACFVSLGSGLAPYVGLLPPPLTMDSTRRRVAAVHPST